MVRCKICDSPSEKVFDTLVLGKYNVSYFKCSHCGFMQTEQPFWLQEAYENAITSLDIGMLKRNNHLAPIVSAVISSFFNRRNRFIDYGGGYGVFVRLMRDKGFDFYRQDIYCENLFARDFDVSSEPVEKIYELLTAFEVFEHLEDPVKEVETMLSYSDNILFTTEIQPHGHPTPDSWWYFIPETGQHISLYTILSLRILAKKYGLRLYTNGKNVHLLTRKRISGLFFFMITIYKFAPLFNIFLIRNRTLLQRDFDLILKKLRNKEPA